MLPVFSTSGLGFSNEYALIAMIKFMSSGPKHNPTNDATRRPNDITRFII